MCGRSLCKICGSNSRSVLECKFTVWHIWHLQHLNGMLQFLQLLDNKECWTLLQGPWKAWHPSKQAICFLWCSSNQTIGKFFRPTPCQEEQEKVTVPLQAITSIYRWVHSLLMSIQMLYWQIMALFSTGLFRNYKGYANCWVKSIVKKTALSSIHANGLDMPLMASCLLLAWIKWNLGVPITRDIVGAFWCPEKTQSQFQRKKKTMSKTMF